MIDMDWNQQIGKPARLKLRPARDGKISIPVIIRGTKSAYGRMMLVVEDESGQRESVSPESLEIKTE